MSSKSVRKVVHPIISYLNYYRNAKTIYDTHSPFLFDFMTEVFDTSREFYIFKSLEYQRKMLKANSNSIEVVDLGAGSKNDLGNTRKISSIASTSLGSKKKCRLLFNLVNKYGKNRILELGTSLGLSSLYMGHARKNSIVDTIEGSPQIANIAKKMFHNNKLKNINLYVGDFDCVLPILLKSKPVYDMIYIDGNHSYNPTINYFNLLYKHISPEGVMVFDDIYWSQEMTEAWIEIKKDPRVSLSIDLYDMGIVFFDPKLTKQNIELIAYHKKPWRIGLF